jgi:hypothetical protein
MPMVRLPCRAITVRAMLLALAVTVIVMLPLVGCADGNRADDDDLRAEYIRSLTEVSTSGSGLTRGEFGCYARAVVDAVGVDRLERAVSPSEIRELNRRDTNHALSEYGIRMSSSDRGTFYRMLNRCFNVKQQLIANLAAQEGLSSGVVDCLESRISSDLARRITLLALIDGEPLEGVPELQQELRSAMAPCAREGTGQA